MQQRNREKLEKYRYILTSRSASGGEWIQEVLEVIREEWDANYTVLMYCPECKMKMIDYAFRKMDEDKTDTVKIKF